MCGNDCEKELSESVLGAVSLTCQGQGQGRLWGNTQNAQRLHWLYSRGVLVLNNDTHVKDEETGTQRAQASFSSSTVTMQNILEQNSDYLWSVSVLSS